MYWNKRDPRTITCCNGSSVALCPYSDLTGMFLGHEEGGLNGITQTFLMLWLIAVTLKLIQQHLFESEMIYEMF